jgi:hypothetical protein
MTATALQADQTDAGTRSATPSGARPVLASGNAPPCRLYAAPCADALKLSLCPAIHSNAAALAAFPSVDKNRAAIAVDVALLEVERFASAEPGASEQNDQRADPLSV